MAELPIASSGAGQDRDSLRTILAEDLLINTGRSGLIGGISAWLFNPGFALLLAYRVTVRLDQAGLRKLAKFLWCRYVAAIGCHLHLEAKIGPGLVLPHPTGIVVGSGAEVGESVTLYQNVTIGRNLKSDRYPKIESGAVIFPNAVIVGDITIGSNSIVGAGSVVISDVPRDTVVAGNPAKVIRKIAPGSSELNIAKAVSAPKP